MRLPKSVIEEIMEEDLDVNTPEVADPEEALPDPGGAAAPLDASDGPSLHSTPWRTRFARRTCGLYRGVVQLAAQRTLTP